MEVICQPPRGD